MQVHLWLLPDAPFADVQQKLASMTLHKRLSRKLDSLLRDAPINAKDWPHDSAPLKDDPTLAITDYPRPTQRETVGEMLGALPADSVLIVINRAKASGRANLLKSTGDPGGEPHLHSTKPDLIWRDLQPGLFQPPMTRRLAIQGQYVSFRLLGGWIDRKERIYPLAMTARDRRGRRVLLWNLAEPMPEDDPRWTLLLRNSLLWAKQQQAAP